MKKDTVRTLAAFATAALVLGACAETDETGASSGGSGLAADASLSEWQEAFADVSPVTIITQTPAPEGSEVGKTYENYFDRVEEYSDGKITFDVSYANAVAGATEVDDALVDGRLDAGNILPVYEPDQYPANAALADASFMGEQAPTVNPLMIHGASIQAAWEVPQVTQELEDQGIKVLLPWYSGDSNGILCPEATTGPEDFNGAQIVTSGKVAAAEVEAAGASPVSLDYTELFQALQRGTVDCSLNSMRVASLMGLLPVANHFTIDDEVGLAKTPGAFAFNADVWDGYPLIVQQLLFDSTAAMLSENIAGSTKFQVDGLAEAVNEGGAVHAFDNATRTAVQGANESALENIAANDALEDGSGLVSTMSDATQEWGAMVSEELGFPSDIAFDEFSDWYEENGYDVQPFVAALYADVMSEQRPS